MMWWYRDSAHKKMSKVVRVAIGLGTALCARQAVFLPWANWKMSSNHWVSWWDAGRWDVPFLHSSAVSVYCFFQAGGKNEPWDWERAVEEDWFHVDHHTENYSSWRRNKRDLSSHYSLCWTPILNKSGCTTNLFNFKNKVNLLKLR